MENRKTFLKKIGLMGAAGIIAPNLFLGCHDKTAHETQPKNWIWITPQAGLSRSEWKDIFDTLKEIRIDAALVQVYSSHKAWFEAAHLPLQEPLLEMLTEVGKETGIEVHAWIWTMPNNNPYYIENHPEFYAVNGLGQSAHTHPAYVGYYRFMCPNQPHVKEFLSKTIHALTPLDNLHGIHFDYIRLPDVIIAEALQPVYGIVQDREYPEYDYCYCNTCRKLFKEETGIDPLKDLEDPSASYQWREFRYNSVTRLVNGTLIPLARRKNKIVTAAVFPNWEAVRQRWSEWEMDAYFPMLYHNFYNADLTWIAQNLEKQIASLKSPAPVYAGLFLPALPDEQLRQAIDISLQAGASGYALFSKHQLSKEHKDILKKTNQ